MTRKEAIFEVKKLMERYFEITPNAFKTWLNAPDPRLYGKTPLQLIKEKGEKSLPAIRGFIYSIRVGDFT